MTNNAILAVAFALAVPVSVTVAAQDRPALGDFTIEQLLQLEVEPVFGASKRLQPVTEAPASVTIITADDIARYGYRTLADILRGVRGFFVTNDRNYSYLGARGFARPGDYNSRILLLVDGHRMNDNVYDQAAIGADFGLDPAMFARVEIIRGPASSLYGTSAFLAVVNVIMRTGASLHGGSVQSELGTFGAHGVRGAIGQRFANGVDAVLSGNYEQTDGPGSLYFPAFDSPATHDGIADRLDDEGTRQAFGRIAVRHLTITGSYGRREKGVPTASFNSIFNDPGERTVDERGFVDTQYERSLGATKVAVRGYVDRYAYHGSYPIPGWEGTAPVVASTDYARGTWWGVDGRATRDITASQTVTVGGEFRDNVRQDQGGGYAEDVLPAYTIEGSSRVAAVFAQDDITLHRRVVLTLGGRYDVYDGFSKVTPRAALVVTPSPAQAFKYLYGRAFRAPNAYELAYYSGGVRDVSLRPETIATHEVVWEQYLGKSLRTSVSAYTSNADRLISLITDDAGALAVVNDDDIRAQGLEVETEVRLKGGIQGIASYGRQRAHDQNTGRPLTNSPGHLAKLRVSIPGPMPRSFVSTEVQYISRRRTLAADTVAPVTVANLTLIAPFGRSFELFAGVRNVFDQRGYDPGSEEHVQDAIQQNGRTVRVALRWMFGAP
jgi:outer membrane receptor for ferrienterochelin and colicins